LVGAGDGYGSSGGWAGGCGIVLVGIGHAEDADRVGGQCVVSRCVGVGAWGGWIGGGPAGLRVGNVSEGGGRAVCMRGGVLRVELVLWASWLCCGGGGEMVGWLLGARWC